MTPDLGRTRQHGQGDDRVHPADRPMAAGRVDFREADHASIIEELARVKVLFQLRTIATIIGTLPAPTGPAQASAPSEPKKDEKR